MAQNQHIENSTVVITDMQMKGKGQHGKTWFSSPYKNLTFSVFTRFKELLISNKTYLNFAISLAIFDCLQDLNTPNLTIKWPNDILSGSKKISGILIEPNFRGIFIKSAIIGIGLNVNEDDFPKEIPNATSLKNIHKNTFNLDEVLQLLLKKLEIYIGLLNDNKFKFLEENYLEKLFKKNSVATFSDKENTIFSGIIRGVSKEGKLLIALEDESIKAFGIQEIKLLS